MIKISQSFLKDYSDYRSDFTNICGLQVRAKYFDGVNFFSSEAMELGNYFEFVATGCLPRDGHIPTARKVYKGTPKEKLATPYERANESAKLYKKIIESYGIEVIEVGMKLETDKMNGIADIYAKWNGRYCFIDLKYSGLLENKWDERGWELNSLPDKHKLMIQGVQYTILADECLAHNPEDFDFFYFVFSSQDPLKAKIIHQVIDPDTIELHKNNVDFVYKQLQKYPLDKIFKAKPSLENCAGCAIAKTCAHKTELPLIEKIYY